MRVLKSLRFFAATALALVTTGQMLKAGDEEVWFYAWHSTIPLTVITEFDQITGSDLIVDTFMVADEAEARLAAMKTDYDLAVVPVEIIPRLMDIDAIRPIDTDQMPTLDESGAEMMAQLTAVVPQARDFSMPFLWGTTGLAFDIEQVKARLPEAPMDSWDLLFDPANAQALESCGISMMDNIEEVISIVLNHLGRDPNSMAPEDLDAAFGKLGEIIPYVKIIGGSQQEHLLNGEACLALTWSSDALVPVVRYGLDHLCYVVPDTGSVLWADVLVVPADTGHLDHTYELVRYLLAPDVREAISAFSYASTNLPTSHVAMAGVAEEVLQMAVPEDRRESLFMLMPRSGAEKRELDRRWRRLQLGL